MAVLVEALSVVIRRDSLEVKFLGGIKGFQKIVPNQTFCADDELVRVGFMTPQDVGEFIELLEKAGLEFIQNDKAIDIAVVDQMKGPTTKVDWLEFARLSINELGDKVSACWFFDSPRLVEGLHMLKKNMSLATPVGWSFEESLAANHTYIKDEEIASRLKFIRHDGGTSVYWDEVKKEEVYIARNIGD